MMSDVACICTLYIAFISTESFVQFVKKLKFEDSILVFTKDDDSWIAYESLGAELSVIVTLWSFVRDSSSIYLAIDNIQQY